MMSRKNVLIVTILSVTIFATILMTPSYSKAQCDKPALLLILDKSSSMVTGTVPSGETKWEAARIAITEVTNRFQSSIDFGLMVFPYPDRCNPGRVVVDIGENNSAQINSYLSAPPPQSGNWTPMAQSLDVASTYPPLSDPSLRRVIVLITDGWQWCDPYDPATRFAPVDAAQRLRAATGATLYVVGFGDGVDALTLNRIAYQSGTYLPGCDPSQTNPLATNNCYHVADSIESLTRALDTIARHTTEEICDNLDNNCDGFIDEGLSRACSTICGTGYEYCSRGSWVGCNAPVPLPEECDAIDNDCDGMVDEGCECVDGERKVCGVDTGECVSGVQECMGGIWGECQGGVMPVEETCDGLDNDCDGTVDEACFCVEGEQRVCGIDAGACSFGTQTCIGGTWGGCIGGVEPKPEECNGIDDDCDNVIDEGCICATGETRTCGTDTGECQSGQQICTDGVWSGCEGAIWPSLEECDGKDNDCNGISDDNAVCPSGQICINGECVINEIPVPDSEIDDGNSHTDENPGCGCSIVY